MKSSFKIKLFLCFFCLIICGCTQDDRIELIKNQDSNLRSFRYHVQEDVKQFIVSVYRYDQDQRYTTFEKTYDCKNAKKPIESLSLFLYTTARQCHDVHRARG